MADENKIKPIAKQPNADLIELCETLLADAKSGEMRSLIGVSLYHAGESRQYFRGDPVNDYEKAGIFLAMAVRQVD